MINPKDEKMKKLLIGLSFVFGGTGMVSAQKVMLYSTTSSERWVEQKCAVDKAPATQADIYVYTDSLQQEVPSMSWDGMPCRICHRQSALR